MVGTTRVDAREDGRLRFEWNILCHIISYHLQYRLVVPLLVTRLEDWEVDSVRRSWCKEHDTIWTALFEERYIGLEIQSGVSVRRDW